MMERLPALSHALHPLGAMPSASPWNFEELADLLGDAPAVEAAVLVGLVPRDNGLRVLLTRRTDSLRHHAGQVSFPGGRIEADDRDVTAAALREAHEEIGLEYGFATPLGFLDPLITITGFRVLPVVAWIDPRFVARRLVILASEDIGNADPQGLNIATSAMAAVEFVGMPEGRIILAQATTYLATAPKSNASYLGLEEATKDIKEGRTLPVPKHLRDSSHRVASQKLGHTGYQYAHDFEGHVVDQEYVPTSKIYYHPTEEGYEKRIQERLARWAELRRQQRKRKQDE